MTRWGMVIDLDKCVGCQACMSACTQENNVPCSEPKRDDVGGAGHQDKEWMQMLAHGEEEYGTDPTEYSTTEESEEPDLNPVMDLMPRPCFHCWDATCVKVCPTRATFIDEEGLVGQIYARCIGCRMCTVGCPYSVRQFNWDRPEWPDQLKNGLNPDVAVRPKHVIERCTYCYHRRQEAGTEARIDGEEVAGEGDFVPACAETCAADAIKFGDIDDPSTEVHHLKDSERASVIMEDLGQKPKTWYLSEREPPKPPRSEA